MEATPQRMAEPRQRPAESRSSQHTDPFLNLEQRQDREGSVHTARDDRNQSYGESHMSHAEKNQSMQKEIDRLKRELRHAKRKRSPSYSNEDSEDEQDVVYKQKLRTPVSKSFTYEEMRHDERNPQNPLPRGAGNDAMSKALD